MRWESVRARHNQVFLASCVVLGICLRLVFLSGRMCHDEAETFVMFVSRPLSVGISHFPFPNNQIFHTILAHLSTGLFGDAPWAVRLPAFIAGVLVIPATFAAVRRLFGVRPALLATALAAVSWPLVSYSANARGYTIQALIVLLLVIVAARVKMKNDIASWVAFIFLGTMGFFTSLTMMYYFGGVVIWLLISAIRRDSPALPSRLVFRLLVACLFVAILVLLLYTPALLRSGLTKQVLNPVTYSLPGNSFASQFAVRMVGVVAFFTFSVMFSFSRTGPVLVMMIAVTAALTVLLIYGFILTCLNHRRLSGNRTNLALVIMAWSALVVLLQGYYPPERVFVPFIPLYLGYAAAGLCFAWSRFRERRAAPVERFFIRRPAVIAVALALALVVLLAQVPWQRRDMSTMRDAEQMVIELKNTLQPGDVVYMEPVVRKSLEYYFMRNGLSLAYLYGTPEFRREKNRIGGRSFIIEAELDGAPMDKTIRWAKLPSRGQMELMQVASFDHANAFLITGINGVPTGEERSLEYAND